MNEDVKDRHSIGGNHPNELLVPSEKEVNSYLTVETAALGARADELCKMGAAFAKTYPKITTEDEQGQASAVVAQIKAQSNLIEKRRKELKRPWTDGGNAIQAHFVKLQERLGSTAGIEKAQTAFANEMEARRRAEAAALARIAQEEADRLATEAAEKMAEGNFEESSEILDRVDAAATEAAHAGRLANARPAEHSRVQSDWGTTASLTETLVIEVTNFSEVPDEHKTFNQSSVRQKVLAAKRNKTEYTCPGVKIEWVKEIRNYSPR